MGVLFAPIFKHGGDQFGLSKLEAQRFLVSLELSTFLEAEPVSKE